MEKESLLQVVIDDDDWQRLLAPLGAKYFMCFPYEKSKKNVWTDKGVVIRLSKKYEN